MSWSLTLKAHPKRFEYAKMHHRRGVCSTVSTGHYGFYGKTWTTRRGSRAQAPVRINARDLPKWVLVAHTKSTPKTLWKRQYASPAGRPFYGFYRALRFLREDIITRAGPGADQRAGLTEVGGLQQRDAQRTAQDQVRGNEENPQGSRTFKLSRKRLRINVYVGVHTY